MLEWTPALKTRSWKNSCKDINQSKNIANSAVLGFGVDNVQLKSVTLLLPEKKKNHRGFMLELIQMCCFIMSWMRILLWKPSLLGNIYAVLHTEVFACPCLQCLYTCTVIYICIHTYIRTILQFLDLKGHIWDRLQDGSPCFWDPGMLLPKVSFFLQL